MIEIGCNNFSFSLDPDDADIALPDEFVIILKIALSKMVSSKCLAPDLISLDFWRSMPNKFKGIRNYEDRKSKIREVSFKTYLKK